jgi:hypothetical protein
MMKHKRQAWDGSQKTLLLGGQKFDGQENNPLLNNMSKAQIQDSITNFMSGDSKFNNSIRFHLFQRLKYSTGKLMESIKWKTKVDITGTNNKFSVSIGVYLTDPQLIDALLSGDELEKYGTNDIPSIEELVRYVEGKRAIFAERTRDRYSPILSQNRQSMKPNRMGDFRTDPIQDIAEEIRDAMEARVYKETLPPTKGSKYTLIGWWRIEKSRQSDGQQFDWFEPKYKRWNTPLYTIENDNGEINQAIKECLQRYFDKMFDPKFGEAIMDEIKDATPEEMLAYILPEIVQDKQQNDKLYQTTEKIFDLIETVQAKVKKENQYKYLFNDLYKKQSKTQKIRIDRMSSNLVTQQKINLASKKMSDEINKYVLRFRKRRVGMHSEKWIKDRIGQTIAHILRGK